MKVETESRDRQTDRQAEAIIEREEEKRGDEKNIYTPASDEILTLTH